MALPYQNIKGLLNEIKKREAFTSDYQLAKFMGWSTSRIGNWRAGRSLPSDRECAHIGRVVDKSALHVMAVAHAEREDDPEIRQIWEYLAKSTYNTREPQWEDALIKPAIPKRRARSRKAGALAAIVVGASLMSGPHPAEAGSGAFNNASFYTLCAVLM